MTVKIRSIALMTLVAVVPLAASRAQQPPTRAASTGDGVFEISQAVRGRSDYQKHCSAGCHMPQLTGSERAPALAGDMFLQRWKGHTVAELFARIRTTMPQQNPRSLSDEIYIDVLAFILQSNGLPSGDHVLEPDPQTLGTISIAGLEP